MKGFTLIELMVSIAIFSVVMTTALGSLLAISYADRKAESLRTVMDNLNFAMEGMSRSIRTGTSYHCGTTGTLTTEQDCAVTGSNYFVFLANDNYYTVYCLNNNAIMRLRVPWATPAGLRTTCTAADGFLPITATEITITNLRFLVRGAPRVINGDTRQPIVTLNIEGSTKISASNTTTFVLQTSMAQRIYDQ